MTFYCLISLLFFNSQASALSYVCVDSLTNEGCDPDTTDYEEAYYAVVEIHASDIREKTENGQTIKYLKT